MPVMPESRRWSDEQLRNARAIINVGRTVGASQRDILIALMTAFQESGMRNLNYGDRDSLGLFQQRAGWASRSARLDPVQSARMFFTGGMRPGTPGLLDNRRRNGMSLTAAAQWVQRSAFPNAYAKWEGGASDLLKFLGVKLTPQTSTPGTLETQAERSGELDTMPGHDPTTGMPLQALGVDSPTMAGATAPGVKSPAAPGIEAGNQMPFGAESPTMGAAGGGGAAGGSAFSLPSPSGYTGPQGHYSLPGVKPWVLSAANEVGGKFGIGTIGGVGQRPNVSDHPGGLALDFMAGRSSGDQLAAYVLANAARLHVKYIIWRQHIWSVGKAGQGWRLMKDRGSSTANHMDHVHVSFNSLR